MRVRPAADAALPLAGLRVLELGRVLAGPFAGLILEDLGAEVVKVENLTDGDSTRATAPFVNGQSHYFLCVNRGKRGVSVDSRNPDGAQLMRRMIGACDLVIHNFRPAVAQKVGLDFDTLTQTKPNLVTCCITGFGTTSSKADHPAYDLVLQAMTGMLDLTRRPGDEPAKAGVPVADLFTGLFTAFAALGGIRRRNRTGAPAELDIALFDVTLSLLAPLAEHMIVTGNAYSALGAGSPFMAPHGLYRTADRLLAIACDSDTAFTKLAQILRESGHVDLNEDPRFGTNENRVRNARHLDQLLADIFLSRSCRDWGNVLDEAGVAWGPVLTLGEALELPHTRERGMVANCELSTDVTVEMVASPFRFDEARNPPEPAPVLGEDTGEVLSDWLGVSDDELSRLESIGAIRTTNSAATI